MTSSRYAMPRALPVPNLGKLGPPPPPGSPGARVANALAALNVRLYRLSGGRIGGRMSRAPVLLLHHVGRKSGTKRVTPALFLADDDRIVLVGSNGGAPKAPAWVLNLRANPVTEVEVGSERVAVRARAATAEERARYWPRLVASYPSYATYQERTEREIPVLVLEPA